jgi:RNA polymerase sigma factor (sigma-70 family)
MYPETPLDGRAEPDRLNHSDETGGWFQTTSWALVVAAGKEDSHEATAALERLCRIYWPALYTYVRRNGHEPEAARDLTQQLFLTLLQRGAIKQADQSRGRFRTYLLTAMKHLLTDEWKAARRLKRGEGHSPLSLDGLEEAERMALEPAETDTPAKAFERRWAQVVLGEAARRHQQEYLVSGRSKLYERLSRFHTAPEDAPGYAAVAGEMGVPIGTLKSLVSRFRRRYRELIRSVIAETVATPDEVEDEIRHLLGMFSS